MRKVFTCILLLPLASSLCIAQNDKLLLDKQIISNWSEYSFYQNMIEESDGNVKWNKAHNFMDSVEIYQISYLSDGLKINGYVVRPKKEGNYPCIIYNRGGNREFGALEPIHAVYFLATLAKEGYVVIASQYRGNAGSEGQEEFGGSDINDVLILPKVLEEIEFADTSRIGMYGWSRGGMMTYLALAKSDRIKAAVVGGAVSDKFASIEDRPVFDTLVLPEVIPNYKENRNEELWKRSAIKWVDKFPEDVPILLLHGNSDWRVKVEQSLNLALEFEKYRIPYRLIVFEGADHGIREFREEVDEQVKNWFERFLKNDEALPNMEYHGR